MGSHTECPGSSDQIYIVSYYIKWVTSWTHSMTSVHSASSLRWKVRLCYFWVGVTKNVLYTDEVVTEYAFNQGCGTVVFWSDPYLEKGRIEVRILRKVRFVSGSGLHFQIWNPNKLIFFLVMADFHWTKLKYIYD